MPTRMLYIPTTYYHFLVKNVLNEELSLLLSRLFEIMPKQLIFICRFFPSQKSTLDILRYIPIEIFKFLDVQLSMCI